MSAAARPTARADWGPALPILIGASVMLSLSMGMRKSFGLFMPAVTRDLAISVADFTFAIALQNMTWGLTQPFVGAVADRLGCRPVTVAGAAFFALGVVATMFASGTFGLYLGMGVFMGLALACTASNLALTTSARAVSPARRSVVLGAVSAAGSLGTLLIAPLAQGLIVGWGWQAALVGFLALSAVMVPAAFFAGGSDRLGEIRPASAERGHAAPGLREALAEAFAHRGYVTMAVAFFVCGLQLVFITTHLPTFLALCGQDPMLSGQAIATIGAFNVGGCYLLGWLGGIYPKQVLLGLVYILRSLAIAAFFLLPVTPASTLLFAAVIGTLWLGVAPLVNGLVAQMFGLRYLATLAGIAFMSHQVGSFLGAWGGGLVYDALGAYDRAWQFGVVVGVVAGLAQIMASAGPAPRLLRAQPA